MSRGRSVVGAKVEIDFAGRRLKGEVIEDRGDIGVRGRKLVRIRWEDSDEEIELPFDDVEVVK